MEQLRCKERAVEHWSTRAVRCAGARLRGLEAWRSRRLQLASQFARVKLAGFVFPCRIDLRESCDVLSLCISLRHAVNKEIRAQRDRCAQ
jgi:hypothetical protein